MLYINQNSADLLSAINTRCGKSADICDCLQPLSLNLRQLAVPANFFLIAVDWLNESSKNKNE